MRLPWKTTGRCMNWRRYFSPVRSVFLLTTVIALAMGWWMRSISVEQAALKRVWASGGLVDFNTDYRDGRRVGAPARHRLLRRLLRNLGRADLNYSPTAVTFSSRDAHIDLAGLEDLPNLTSLRVFGGNSNLRAVHPSLLKRLKVLEFEDIQMDPRSLEVLRDANRLISLDLCGTNVDDAALDSLSRLHRLENLNLAVTRVTDVGVAKLYPLAANLRSLHIGWTEVSNEGMMEIAKLHRLEELCLHLCAVDKDGLAHLGRIPRLSSVTLAGPHVTLAEVLAVTRIDSLKEINVSLRWDETLVQSEAFKEWIDGRDPRWEAHWATTGGFSLTRKQND